MSEYEKSQETRFGNLELDDSAPPAQAPVEPDVPGQTVREGAAQKAQEEKDLNAKYLGIEAGKNLFGYEDGTVMLDSGVDVAYSKRREEWDNRPLFKAVAADHRNTIQNEKRREVNYLAKDCRLDEEGKMVLGANERVELNDWAYQQLANRAPDGSVKYNLNSWLSSRNREYVFRLREGKTTPEAFAVVTPRYAIFDSDQLVEVAERYMPSDSRGELLYDGSKARIDVSLSNPFDVPDEVTVGRTHRVGLRITTADDGSRSLKIKTFAERIACINCTILMDSNLMFSRKHVGDSSEFAQMVEEALSRVGEGMQRFSELWQEANENQIHDRYDGTPLGAQEVFQRLVAHGYVKVPYLKPHQLVERLMQTWEREPGDTAAAVNRAVSRLAWEGANEWRSPWYQDDLEEQAGTLLYSQVYNLNPLSKKQRELFEF